jgi:hypothetical protein
MGIRCVLSRYQAVLLGLGQVSVRPPHHEGADTAGELAGFRDRDAHKILA